MILGIFKKELPIRFLAKVKVNGKIEECHMSSSSHLLPMINLIDKQVLLKENKGNNLRTKYTVQALWEENKILLNLNYVNNIFRDYLEKSNNKLVIKREHKINNYKTDFYIPEQNKIIETKAILSQNDNVTVPFLSGERCIRQLKSISLLLKQGYDVEYCFILLNPKIKKIIIDQNNKSYFDNFNICVDNGMKISYYDAIYNNDKFVIETHNILK